MGFLKNLFGFGSTPKEPKSIRRATEPTEPNNAPSTPINQPELQPALSPPSPTQRVARDSTSKRTRRSPETGTSSSGADPDTRRQRDPQADHSDQQRTDAPKTEDWIDPPLEGLILQKLSALPLAAATVAGLRTVMRMRARIQYTDAYNDLELAIEYCEFESGLTKRMPGLPKPKYRDPFLGHLRENSDYHLTMALAARLQLMRLSSLDSSKRDEVYRNVLNVIVATCRLALRNSDEAERAKYLHALYADCSRLRALTDEHQLWDDSPVTRKMIGPLWVNQEKGCESSSRDSASNLETSPADSALSNPEPGKIWTLPLGEEMSLDMIWCPPGEFLMGSAQSEAGRMENEGPQTRVTLTKGFWLSKHCITAEQYDIVVRGRRIAERGSCYSWGLEGSIDNIPVEDTSWFDAIDFCEELTNIEHVAARLPSSYIYTLPTEAQWEYACRAGTEGMFSIAGEFEAIGWTRKNYKGRTAVAQKLPNKFGLHDMHGPNLEWCLDYYAPQLPGGTQVDLMGPSSGDARVIRGGKGWDGELSCRSACRDAERPGNHRGIALSFRIALSALPISEIPHAATSKTDGGIASTRNPAKTQPTAIAVQAPAPQPSTRKSQEMEPAWLEFFAVGPVHESARSFYKLFVGDWPSGIDPKSFAPAPLRKMLPSVIGHISGPYPVASLRKSDNPPAPSYQMVNGKIARSSSMFFDALICQVIPRHQLTGLEPHVVVWRLVEKHSASSLAKLLFTLPRLLEGSLAASAGKASILVLEDLMIQVYKGVENSIFAAYEELPDGGYLNDQIIENRIRAMV